MLQPKRTKYRKSFRGKMKGISTRGDKLDFGDFGLKAFGCGWISSRQLEAARKAISHYTKRGGKTWIRIFPDKPITKKPAETRMGGGKGEITEYVAVVRPGRIIFEIGAVDESTAAQALIRAAAKLPIKTKLITKGSFVNNLKGYL